MTRDSMETLVSLFTRRVAVDGDRRALWFRVGEKYHALIWNEIARDVRRTAAALFSSGVQPGDRVVQVSENRYEWILCDLAIAMLRAVHVPVHASLTGAQIAYQIANSGAKLVLISTPEQAAKLNDQLAGFTRDLRLLSIEPAIVLGHTVTQLSSVIDCLLPD